MAGSAVAAVVAVAVGIEVAGHHGHAARPAAQALLSVAGTATASSAVAAPGSSSGVPTLSPSSLPSPARSGREGAPAVAPPSATVIAPSVRPSNRASTPTTSAVPAVTHTGIWRPAVATTWQWQLSGSIDTSVAASVYDIDAESSAATVATLHAQGRHVICYVDVGSWEPGRPDASRFPASVRGKKMTGWDENWLDIRQVTVLEPLMAARFDTCKAKGFDAIEPDNVDGYTNSTGFALTGADQLAYNRMIAQLAHQRGLGVGLKNDLDQTGALASSFDFAVNEQCAEYDECSSLAPFVSAGKAVLHVEYNVSVGAFCGKYPGFSSMRKRVSLDAWREPC